MRPPLSLLVFTLVAAVACSGDSTGPGATYESIAGNYSGAMTGMSQGIALDGTFSLTVDQNRGTTSGTYGIAGTLYDGTTSLDVAGTGTLTGTVAAGNNPSVNITVRTPMCPNYQAHFSGTYDVPNRRLTMIGPIEFFNDSCTVVLSYPSTIVLTR